MSIDFEGVKNKSLNNEYLTRKECISILNISNEDFKNLLNITYEIRKKYKGNRVSIQILTNAKSGNCSQDCAYCAQSCVSKANIDKYPLVPYEKLLNDGKIGKNKNIARHCIGLSGLTFTDSQIDEFCEYVKNLKKEIKTDICCSIGFLTLEQAKKLKEAGVNRINHNLNTGENFYNNICSTHTYQQRINNIKMLQSIGFEMCCGGIVGLGETQDDIVDMLFDIKKINPKSVPINFLIPIKGTPLEKTNISKLTPEYCIKVLCLARLLNPQADIRCAAGRELHIKDKQNLMFYAVNSIFASGYLTTNGQNIDDTIKLIEDSGFEYEIE